MSNSGERFYQLEFRHRPVLHGDIGSLLKIDGLVVSGGGAQAILMLPSSSDDFPSQVIRLNDEQWTDFLQRSDVPELMMPGKAFHRKAKFEISGMTQQRVWVADGFKCIYCKRKMGEVQLTIDHFMPLEMGGKNDSSNYLSACRRCNKDKGAQDPKDFCKLKGLEYPELVKYLLVRVV